MKKFIKSLVIAVIVAMSYPSCANAQVKRGEWDFSPVITTTNSIYGLLFTGAGATINSPWYPRVFNRWAVMQSVNTPDGHAKIKYLDWELRNIAVAYSVSYQSKVTPFGFSFSVGYEKRGLQTTLPHDEKCYFNRQMVNPTLLLNLRLGNYIENSINPVVELGGSYDYVFACKGLSKNIDSVNSGFHGIFGVGIGNTMNHIQATLRYEQDFYNWFNESYSPDGGATHPYKGWKSKMGYLSVNLRCGF